MQHLRLFSSVVCRLEHFFLFSQHFRVLIRQITVLPACSDGAVLHSAGASSGFFFKNVKLKINPHNCRLLLCSVCFFKNQTLMWWVMSDGHLKVIESLRAETPKRVSIQEAEREQQQTSVGLEKGRIFFCIALQPEMILSPCHVSRFWRWLSV